MRSVLLALCLTLFACGSDDGLDDVSEVMLVSYGQPNAAPKVEPVTSRRVIVMETCVVTPKPAPQPCDE